MFDVSFSELVLILIVGLLVFGPEKLPEVVRTAGLWIGKIRRSFNQIRSEIEREVGVDEIKREIHNQSILDSLKDVRNDLHKAHQDLRDLPYDVTDIVNRQHDAAAEPAPIDSPAGAAPITDANASAAPAVDNPAPTLPHTNDSTARPS